MAQKINKPHQIRKRALEYVRERRYEEAVNEYVRLSEIEANNPNVFNELGDLHLKIGNKMEAFEALHSAVDAYTGMGLLNNAVAVCKKIIRLNGKDRDVFQKLARLRSRQGIQREADTYAVSFLDHVESDVKLDPEKIKAQLVELAADMEHTPEVLERVSDYLIAHEFNEEAGAVLESLAREYAAQNKSQEVTKTTARMDEIGHVPDAPVAGTGSGDAADPGGETVPGIDDAVPDTQPTGFAGTSGATAMDFDAVELGGAPETSESATATQSGATPAAGPSVTTETEVPGASPAPDGAFDIPAPDDVELPTEDSTASDTSPGSEADSGRPDDGVYDLSDEPQESAAPASGDPKGPTDELSEGDVWIPTDELPDGLESRTDGDGGVVSMSDLVGHFSGEVKSDVDADDYRSHYDLGMAYLEMDLVTEAIREFQFASNSSMYQARSLELIGECFLKQNQPKLAIKQLEKGIKVVGREDRDSIGLLYNLGLAYEMVGDADKAKGYFEEVYVFDVTFKDIGEKIKQYS